MDSSYSLEDLISLIAERDELGGLFKISQIRVRNEILRAREAGITTTVIQEIAGLSAQGIYLAVKTAKLERLEAEIKEIREAEAKRVAEWAANVQR